MLVLKLFLFIISGLMLLVTFLFGSRWLNQIKAKPKISLIFLSILIVTISLTFWIKDYPLFNSGECFTVENKSINETGEAWHKPPLVQNVEYQILKVGKKNYLVHSSIPTLEDFKIILDVTVKKSDCNLIFTEK